MSNPDIFEITLPAGTKVSDCKIYSPEKGILVPCNKDQLKHSNAGQLQYNPQDRTALFNKPSFADCNKQNTQAKCQVTLTLPKASLDKLKENNKDLAQYIFASTDHPTPAEVQPKPPPKDYLFLIPFASVAIILSIIGLLVSSGPARRLLFHPSSRKRNPRISTPASHQSAQSNWGDQFPTANPSQSSLDIINLSIQKLTSKFDEIHSRVNGIDDRLLSLEEEVKSPGKLLQPTKSHSSLIEDSPRNEATFQSYDIRKSSLTPPTLTIDTIKQAVETCSYKLITPYPHEFLSETEQSRQGLEDPKKFQIEGDHSQAKLRTQSEFIAIPCEDNVYLIPNILPNASNPAGTIKRHADKSHIYRLGQGTNHLEIQELATVRKNGNMYEILSLGQIK